MANQPNLQRCEDLWFEDGTVVLQAENTLFRVYSGILSRNSTFFETLFRLPQPADEEMYEGCPLVVLAGDTAQAARRFLLALHDRHFPSSYVEEASMAIDLLRMSSKYDASMLKEAVLKAMWPYFPTTLAGLHDMYGDENSSFKSLHRALDLMAITALFAAHAPRHLPVALMVLTTFTLRTKADGTTMRIIDIAGPSYGLDPFMRRKIHAGKYILSCRARIDVYPSLFRASDCAAAASCNAAKLAIIPKVEAKDGCIYPLQPARASSALAMSSLCQACGERYNQDRMNGLQRLWDDLPNIFDIATSWDVLLRDELERNVCL